MDEMIVAVNTMVNTLGPKLDADTGVADTDYTDVLSAAFSTGSEIKRIDLIL